MKITAFKKNVNMVKIMIENYSDIDHLKKQTERPISCGIISKL